MSTSNTTKPTPLFIPFEWVAESDQADTGRYTMLSNIRDLAAGVGLALQMVERAELQKDLGDVPVIDDSAVMRFTRMSVAAMNVIEGYIDEHFDDMSERGAEQRRAAKLREQL